jgi:V/A-type H+-transporting ATPase subunit E
MSQHELMAALRQEGEAKIAVLWHDAEAKAEALREKNAGKLAEFETEVRGVTGEKLALIRRPILARAAATAQRLVLVAEDGVAQRLRILAEEFLPLMREDDYPETFAALVAELPPALWTRVTLHPDDLARGAASFPGAVPCLDSAINGGVAAETAGGGISVVNTLDKRLERAWPEILPVLMKEVRRVLDSPGTAEDR